eukprot:TRINITY_DN45717_c0_g1_i1.p1 TRINITY_DN45717_c0_g1~~TRINITY_DN45717_c0_g1_i1.p1  ORF type:complete len:242 (-),score=64.53 TRINITY_DN45717_c0_g1_i1:66-791(-)
MSMSEDEEWTPPSEAEMKVLQAKRERSDKISKLMGDYLLKGYRMLATSCPQCYNIELQDRSGNLYCVACQEVDCHETSKDNPAISQRAASRGIAEEAFATQRSPSNQNIADNLPATGAQPFSNASASAAISINPDIIPRGQPETLGARTRTPLQHSPLVTPVMSASSSFNIHPTVAQQSGGSQNFSTMLSASLVQVLGKLDWANSQLGSNQAPEKATELVILVRECAETAHKIKQIMAQTN